jgi:hypothetical protein
MNKLILTIMARCASSRLPNKACYDLGGVPAFIHALDNVLVHIQPDYVFLLTTLYPEDDGLCFIARQHGIDVFRGANTISYRQEAFLRFLDAKDDWYWIALTADHPFQLHTWWRDVLPIVLEGDYDAVCPITKHGSIVAELNPVIIWRTWVIRHQIAMAWTNAIKCGELHTTIAYGPLKAAFVKTLDEWADEPWPFGMTTLDYPVQKLMLGAVYRELYQGYPLHPAEVYNFLKDHPYTGQMVNQSLDILRANQPVFPMGAEDVYAGEVKTAATKVDTIEWREGDYELVEGYFRPTNKKIEGDKNEKDFNRLRDHPYSGGVYYHSYYPPRTYDGSPNGSNA